MTDDDDIAAVLAHLAEGDLAAVAEVPTPDLDALPDVSDEEQERLVRIALEGDPAED